MSIPRSEYPRPQFMRENWLNLNGTWDFSFDTDTFDKKIVVPYVYQSKLSGIHTREAHDVVWYRKSFKLPAAMAGKRILLHFGAVDYECDLWVNDRFILHHTGGHISFQADITHALRDGENQIRLRVTDEIADLEMPRGKQYWHPESASIFYTPSTGIWQTVWLEAVSDTYLAHAWITPDLDRMAVDIQYEIQGHDATQLQIDVLYQGERMASHMVETRRGHGSCTIAIDYQQIGKWSFIEDLLWTPEHPNLLDLHFTLKRGQQVLDSVQSYFGMRKVSVEQGRFMLNNRPYYQKLLLDQGYWPDGLLTAPADEDFVTDIRLSKQMGFNGVRKHQKIEDPRFLYHADKMGFLVWGEIAAAYAYSRRYVKRITQEWLDEIRRDYNHPSIVAWTPLNESWGIGNVKDSREQQSHSAAMVYLTKSLDQTRPVISNDGWEHTCTDLLTIHDYHPDKAVLLERYRDVDRILAATPAGRVMIVGDWKYEGQPILVTEFGGISYQKGETAGWGYSNASSDEDFARRYYDVTSAMLESKPVQGFCYTQLTDVEQEINGLLTYDRKPKIDLAIIRAINEGTWKPE